MNTPIVDFVRQYASRNASRFHMPGHKGVGDMGCERLDITEIEGADVLYGADGIIARSEANATSLFGTAHTYYSAEGSSLVIKAMLSMLTLADRREGKRPLILAVRNVHKAFVYACALLDLDVVWISSRANEHLCSCTVLPCDVEAALRGCERKPAALYLTSPDYLGQTLDIQGIAEVCHRFGVPLAVDNAHGAYLRFLEPSRHPMDLGADLCCDSAHKTLPVLTGGAYLHISKNADPNYLKIARSSLALFASTSPSYLILQSLDLCNAYLANGYRARLAACVDRIEKTKTRLLSLGVAVLSTEPLKIVIDTAQMGYCGTALADLMRGANIEPELADRNRLVLMITPETGEEDLSRLVAFFAALPKKEPIVESLPTVSALPELQCSIREAILSPFETVRTEDAIGRICASPTVSCPPAVPVVVSGERIGDDTIETLLFYGIDRIDVCL